MTLEITVRGSAEQRYPAERAIVSMAAAVEGPDRKQVFQDAVAIHDPLVSQLRDLVELRAVGPWSSDQVRVFSHRPWEADGKRGALVHVARVHVTAEFTDFERLSGFLDFWSGTDGVEVSGIAWDVNVKSRRSYEAEIRKAAVDDAVAKAQSYANAVRRGKVGGPARRSRHAEPRTRQPPGLPDARQGRLRRLVRRPAARPHASGDRDPRRRGRPLRRRVTPSRGTGS